MTPFQSQVKTLTVSIDAELQAYGEFLMQNKIGGIVAIEPSSGEILSCSLHHLITQIC